MDALCPFIFIFFKLGCPLLDLALHLLSCFQAVRNQISFSLDRLCVTPRWTNPDLWLFAPPPLLLFDRTTAFGFLNALCKLAAVLGISIFTSFVGITKAVPILFASGALAAGSFLALKLPETRGQVLQ